jgi:hypothetical protein
MMFAGLSWLALALSYLVFAGQVSRNELIAGFGACAIAVGHAVIAHRAADAPMRLRLRWDRVIGIAATSLVMDTIRVGAALLRPRPGALSPETLPLDEAVPSGRRAVAILTLSLAPNGFVVRADGTRAVMHQLVPTDPRQPSP